MNTTVVCSEVRPSTENHKGCVVIASHEKREGVGAMELTAPSNLAEIRDRLHAQGIVLGAALQLARKASIQSNSAASIQLIAHDECGEEHRLIVDYLEEYSLSSGSTLYYFYLPEAQCDCRWLVGRTLEVAGNENEGNEKEDAARSFSLRGIDAEPSGRSEKTM